VRPKADNRPRCKAKGCKGVALKDKPLCRIHWRKREKLAPYDSGKKSDA